MSLSFLPSYLRTWIETEASCKEEQCDLLETIDEQNDWVLVDYRNETNEGKQLDDLLQEYIVIEGQESDRSRREDDAWVDVGQKATRTSEQNSLQKSARRARKRARRTAERYLGIPFKNTKSPANQIAPKWPRTSAAPTVKIDSCKQCLSSNIPSIKPYETQVDKSIVPFYDKGPREVSYSEVLRVFQDLSKKTATAVVYCDFAQLNALNVCTTRDLFCVKNSYPVEQICAMSARDKCIFTDLITHDKTTLDDMMTRDQCMCPDFKTRGHCMFPPIISSDLPIVNNKLMLPFHADVENDDEDVFDCIDSASKIFSLSTSEALYSKFYTTKKKFEDLLRSLLLLHLFVGKKLQSWKDITMSNISKLSSPQTTAVHTSAPLYDVTKSFAAVPQKSRGHVGTGNVTGKQLRRQNRMAMRNNVASSNRQRGMKCGRFQNNVGRRESWH